MILKKGIMIFAFLLALIYVLVFLFPGHVEKLALSPAKVYQGEVWRFITYPFTHLGQLHLIENIIGLFLIALTAVELKSLFSDFSLTYLITGFFAVIPLWVIMQFTALGASTAVYGGFGLISLEVRKYGINPWYVIGIFAIMALSKTAYSLFTCGAGCKGFVSSIEQGLSHLSGLIFGAAFLVLFNKTKPFFIRKKLSCLRSFAEVGK